MCQMAAEDVLTDRRTPYSVRGLDPLSVPDGICPLAARLSGCVNPPKEHGKPSHNKRTGTCGVYSRHRLDSSVVPF